jgi:DNA polymerase-3 subunit epsilon
VHRDSSRLLRPIRLRNVLARSDSMREIVFDTETTGLDHRVERVIEIGAIELVNRFPTGRTYHVYINPDGREIHPDAQAVHGISAADLVGKPVFAGIAAEFAAFIDGATLVAHNAGFDMGFINAEFGRVGLPPVDPSFVVDTLAIARRKHPMGPNSLDALCKRYGIDNSHRTRHGALLDSGLLAEVYIELIGGKQAAFGLDVSETATSRTEERGPLIVLRPRPEPLAPRLTAAEAEAHAKMVGSLGGNAIWLKPEFQPGRNTES